MLSLVKVIIKPICGRLVVFLFLTQILSEFAMGATQYYVSPNGTASWMSSMSKSSPCSAITAMNNAVSGDIVLFLDGQYDVIDDDGDYKEPALNPKNSGDAGSPIIFKSLNYHGANINGIGETSTSYSSTIVGSNNRNYITWDGFLLSARDKLNTKQIYATARFQNSTGCVIKNCKLIGGIHSKGGATNNAGVFFEFSKHLIIENNELYGYKESSNNENNGAINGYDSDHITIKNNNIFDSTIGIHFKDNIDDSLILNNFIFQNYMGIYISNTNTNGGCERVVIRNNIIAKNSFIGIEVPANGPYRANDLVVNDNTIYGNNVVALSIGETDTGHYPKVFNNIFFGSKETFNTKGYANQIAECDHNFWSGSFQIKTHQYENNETNYRTLSSWQTSGELDGGGNPGVGSLSGDPFFENQSGNFSQLSDYKLLSSSPAKRAGRNGGDMGADSSLVGPLDLGPDPPPSIPPLPPTDFKPNF